MVRAIFFHLRDKRRSSPGHRTPAARRPSSPQQMAMAAASSPSPNDSGCAAEPRPPPGGGARGGATSRSTGGREHRVGTCESLPGSRQDGGGGSQPPGRTRPNPASWAASPTRPSAASHRGPQSYRALSRRRSRELTQSRSLGPLLGPTRRCKRSNKSRSRRAEREDAPPTNDQTALRSKPPDASIFIETLHAASVRHRTLICIHQRLFRLAGAFDDALTSLDTKAVLRARFLIGRCLGH